MTSISAWTSKQILIGCLVRDHVSILIQHTNLAPCNALRSVVRQCVNLIDIEIEAIAELAALSLLTIHRTRLALVSEDDVPFTINEATEIILARKFSCR